MYVWNVPQAARWKYRTQKLRQKSPSAHHRTTLSGYIFATKACIDNRKKLLNANTPFKCPHNMVNFGQLTAEIRWRVWATPVNFNGFRSCLRYCSDVAYRRPTKLCAMYMYGRLLSWYTIYTLLGVVAPERNFASCKIHFASKSCVLLYWQRYCTALKQWASVRLCGVVQGMELRNFRRVCHLCSAGRPSRWASTRVLVCFLLNF